MRYRIENGVDPDFRAGYEGSLLAACGDDPLPNPRGARHEIFHNIYDRSALARLSARSGLRPHGSAVVEKRNYLVVRKPVNVFVRLVK